MTGKWRDIWTLIGTIMEQYVKIIGKKMEKWKHMENDRVVKCYPGNRWKWSKQLFSKKTVKKNCTRTCAQTKSVKNNCTRTCAQTKTVKQNVPEPVPKPTAKGCQLRKPKTLADTSCILHPCWKPFSVLQFLSLSCLSLFLSCLRVGRHTY